MGSSASKPVAGHDSHVWKANGPLGVSQDVVDSLQSSSESDTSRQQALELTVQKRVAAELRKLSSESSELLKKATQATEGKDDGADSASKSSETVSKEVEALRARLDKRKQLRPLPEKVETARGEVVRCLMEHDRRPLDCWQEVETFKEEVRRLEKSWVDKVVR
ncbi:hypothetical protein F5Y15DRAFT_369718 [Xylariaceae sp. FL0016]|nr:hypothetical protein F5Y15DRAFT_369718 [Xylariaceae sp. FL0016]